VRAVWGSVVSRTVCVLAFTAGTGASVPGALAAGSDGSDGLFQRRPERLLIESGERVSDGRKLQQDADTRFRRAEGSAAVSDHREEAGSSGAAAATAATNSGRGTSADR
jgi:hypothetical protein